MIISPELADHITNNICRHHGGGGHHRRAAWMRNYTWSAIINCFLNLRAISINFTNDLWITCNVSSNVIIQKTLLYNNYVHLWLDYCLVNLELHSSQADHKTTSFAVHFTPGTWHIIGWTSKKMSLFSMFYDLDL